MTSNASWWGHSVTQRVSGMSSSSIEAEQSHWRQFMSATWCSSNVRYTTLATEDQHSEFELHESIRCSTRNQSMSRSSSVMWLDLRMMLKIKAVTPTPRTRLAIAEPAGKQTANTLAVWRNSRTLFWKCKSLSMRQSRCICPRLAPTIMAWRSRYQPSLQSMVSVLKIR